jgi:2-(3-amino-3-carboxypropyl)histidine synthase
MASAGTVVKKVSGRRARRIPDSILNDPDIAAAIATLPDNYNFEIHKTIWKLREANPPAKKVALQFPEGLLLFATVIGDIIERFTGTSFVVMGDVTYGACCVDDLTAKSIGCDFLVHYGHSCLVPVAVTNSEDNSTPIRTLYVFVEIAIDVQHIVECIQFNFGASKETPLTIMGTIQFSTALHEVAHLLSTPKQQPNADGTVSSTSSSSSSSCFADVLVPQGKPLSPGETLGCTSPRLFEENGQPRQGTLVFIADGRFHLEAAMIHNPQLTAYRYDPYGKTLTRERYDIEKMKSTRSSMIEKAKDAPRWGIILGTLGRQGNPAIFGHLKRMLKQRNRKTILVLVSKHYMMFYLSMIPTFSFFL